MFLNFIYIQNRKYNLGTPCIRHVRVAKRSLFGGMRSVISGSEMMPTGSEESLFASVFAMSKPSLALFASILADPEEGITPLCQATFVFKVHFWKRFYVSLTPLKFMFHQSCAPFGSGWHTHLNS